MKFARFILCFITTIPGLAQEGNDANDFKLITTDIDAFWKAFDEFKADTTSNPFEDYLNNGTPALKDLRMTSDARTFKKVIRSELSYYEKLRASSYDILKYKEKIRQYYNNFKAIYPPASFPDIYFCPAQFRTGATASQAGIIVGIEMFADSEYENSRGFKSTTVDNLPVIIAISLVYYNHRPAHTGHTLLRQCILQGSAEFLASLIVDNDNTDFLFNERFYYGQQHEESLVKEFLQRMNGDDFTGWLYENKKNNDRPAGMGVWIGFKITEAYYHSTPDKTKAIDDILKINDFEKFLKLSGYVVPFQY